VRFVLLVVIALIVAVARPVAASPMTTTLTTVRTDAVTIVIGTMSKTSLAINVESVIRGSVPLGWKKMKTSPDGDSDASGRVIAFLDKDDQFRWVGYPMNGGTIESGVLHLSGFFNWNAHLVSPGTMTLAQLKNYLATGALVQRFSARLTAEDTTGKYPLTGQSFGFDYDPFTRKITNAQIPGKCLDQLQTFGLDWGEVQLMFGDMACPHGGQQWRRLDLRGEPTGVNAKGEITLDVSATRPFLDQADLATFLNDGTIVDVKRYLDVKLADGTTWQWELGEGLIDPQGAAHKAGAMSSSSRTTAPNVETHTIEYDFDTDFALTFTNPKPASMSSGGGGYLVAMADAKGYDACNFAAPGKPDRACTIGRGTSKIVR
jgi:hypothetical protein